MIKIKKQSIYMITKAYYYSKSYKKGLLKFKQNETNIGKSNFAKMTFEGSKPTSFTLVVYRRTP